MAETAVQEQPKTELVVAEAAPVAEKTPEGTIVADQQAEKGFRRYNSDTQSYETLPNEIGDEKPAEQKVEEAKPEQKAPETPKKLWAGKFNSEEEMEKAYLNLEKDYHAKNQQRTKDTEAAAKPAAEQVVKEQVKKTDYATLLLEKPEEFESTIVSRAVEAMQTAAQTKAMQAEWERANPDLKGMEHLVRTELTEILASQPDKAKGDLSVLLNEATGNLRARLQSVIAQAKQEALTIRSTVQPLGLSNEARKQEPQNPADKGAATSDPTDSYVAERKKNFARVSGRTPAR